MTETIQRTESHKILQELRAKQQMFVNPLPKTIEIEEIKSPNDIKRILHNEQIEQHYRLHINPRQKLTQPQKKPPQKDASATTTNNNNDDAADKPFSNEKSPLLRWMDIIAPINRHGEKPNIRIYPIVGDKGSLFTKPHRPEDISKHKLQNFLSAKHKKQQQQQQTNNKKKSQKTTQHKIPPRATRPAEHLLLYKPQHGSVWAELQKENILPPPSSLPYNNQQETTRLVIIITIVIISHHIVKLFNPILPLNKSKHQLSFHLCNIPIIHVMIPLLNHQLNQQLSHFIKLCYDIPF
eukprot:UN00586